MCNRDDFTLKVKETLANRVGRRCSNPQCRTLTCCANSNPESVTNVGVAAHICAAAIGGPRYDPKMSSEKRKSIENGIWLCQNCAKMIDNDIERYPKELLYIWKNISENEALREVESNKTIENNGIQGKSDVVISNNTGNNFQLFNNSTIIGNITNNNKSNKNKDE